MSSISIAGVGGARLSPLDLMFRRALVFSKLYTKSWGEPLVLKDLRTYLRTVMSQRGVSDVINAQTGNQMQINKIVHEKEAMVLEGFFRSPHAIEFPHHMEGPVQWAHWRGIFPKGKRKAFVLHLAGTGDHSYFRREKGFARGLLENHGTASIMLHNPFYASRRPPNQFRSSLCNVSDLFVMGAALIAESLFVLNWARQEGYWPLGISGVSMGGHMCCLAGTNARFPVALIPCLSWTTASPVYTLGALSYAIPYAEVLAPQLEDLDYRKNLEAMVGTEWLERAKAMKSTNKMSLSHNLMWIMMHDFTHLGQYPVPMDTSLVHSVVAEQDAYVLRNGTPHLQDIWPNAIVESIPDRGHVAAYFSAHAKFRAAVQGRLNASASKYPVPPNSV